MVMFLGNVYIFYFCVNKIKKKFGERILGINYILIDELELDFSKGLNIITGETGAGKSILINAIDIAFGAKVGKEVVYIEIDGKDSGTVIGKRGQTLDSLQYLVSLVVNKESEDYLRVKLDTENYRERRKETLETLAKNIAYKVKRTRRSVSLEPMNPYERRIIHSALQNDKYVFTRSEGEEPFRHVVISLKREERTERRRPRTPRRDYNKTTQE